jgi:hypothetical protein
MSPLLTFDDFEAAVPQLIAEADEHRDELHPYWRLGDDGPLAVIGHLTRALVGLLPQPRTVDVRAELLAVSALALEALAAVRSVMTETHAATRANNASEAIAEAAFATFSAPGGLPDDQLEWCYALDNVGAALGFLFNPRLGGEIGPNGAHDALERTAGHIFCTLAMAVARQVR